MIDGTPDELRMVAAVTLFPDDTVDRAGGEDESAAGKTSVYRLYDRGGCLLYVGITSTGTKRFAQHRDSQPWFDDVAQAEFEHYDTRREALAREAFLIWSSRPIHNKALNGRPGSHHCVNPGRPARECLAALVAEDPDPTIGLHCCDWMKQRRILYKAETEALRVALATPRAMCPECLELQTSLREIEVRLSDPEADGS